MHVPPYGLFPTTQSKYYPGQMVEPVSGTHYDSETGLPTHVQPHPNGATSAQHQQVVLHWDNAPATTDANRVLRFVGVFAAILALAGLVAYAFSSIYVVPLVIAMFLGGLLMPVMRVVPWADEDADDAFLFLLLTLVGGPLVALVVYGVIALMRQNANPAILGGLTVALAARVVVDVCAGVFALGHLNPFAQVGHFDWRMLLINWAGLMTMAGWYAASVFHKLDE